jgi:hypothetical protein
MATLYRLAFTALALLAGAIAMPASAQDVNRCIDQCFNVYPANQLRDMCTEKCSASSSSTPFSPHGAIAFDPQTASWGVAYGMSTEGKATRAAMARCRENNGTNCEIAASYSNSCAAVATVRNKARYIAVQADSREAAKDGAVEKCQSEIGGDCKLWVYSCASDKD